MTKSNPIDLEYVVFKEIYRSSCRLGADSLFLLLKFCVSGKEG